MICVGSGPSSMDLMYLLSTSIFMQDFEVFVSFRSGKGLFYGRDFSQEQSVRRVMKETLQHAALSLYRLPFDQCQ